MKIILTGGGTAGHIYPLISVFKELKKNHPFAGFDFLYLGPKDKFARSIFSSEGVRVKNVMSGKMRRYFSFKNFLDIFKIPIGFLQAFYHIFVFSPDIIFSKGGYGSIPVVIIGWIMRTPIILHESDIVPGLANKIAGKFAIEIFISFPIEETKDFPAKKVLSLGNPIRSEILEGDKEKVKEIFGLSREKPLIFIMGGSQGAQNINNKIFLILSQLLNDFEVIHQTGESNLGAIKQEINVILGEDAKKRYRPVSFLDIKTLPHVLKAADLIISRAGSGSIFEIAALGKPSILVPLENSAQDHQVRNAYSLSQKGGTIVIEEGNFRPHFILERIKYLFSNPEKLEEIGKRAKDFSKPNAAKIIAEYIITYLNAAR